MSKKKSKKATVPVSAIWLRRRGLYAEVLAEIDGEWRQLVAEPYDGNFSHIVEYLGLERAKKADI